MNAATITCPKCLGCKRLATFAHIENGLCFHCGGAGTVPAHHGSTSAAAPVTSAAAVAQLRTLYAAARSQGEGWFIAVAQYDTAPHVAFWLGELADAATTAKVRDAFDALGAPSDWMARAGL